MKDKYEDMKEWAEARRLYCEGEALANAERYAELLKMITDAERWQALMNSQRMRVLGTAGMLTDGSDWDSATFVKANPDSAHMHFGIEVWDVYNKPADYVDTQTPWCRKMLAAYADEIIAPTQNQKLLGRDASQVIVDEPRSNLCGKSVGGTKFCLRHLDHPGDCSSA